MRVKIARDFTESISLEPRNEGKPLTPEMLADAERRYESVAGGAHLALCGDQEGGVAFTALGHEWLSNRWGESRLVKIEIAPDASFTDGQGTWAVVSDASARLELADFFERCAARLRNKP